MPEVVSRREEGRIKQDRERCVLHGHARKKKLMLGSGNRFGSIGIMIDRRFTCVRFLVADGKRSVYRMTPEKNDVVPLETNLYSLKKELDQC